MPRYRTVLSPGVIVVVASESLYQEESEVQVEGETNDGEVVSQLRLKMVTHRGRHRFKALVLVRIPWSGVWRIFPVERQVMPHSRKLSPRLIA